MTTKLKLFTLALALASAQACSKGRAANKPATPPVMDRAPAIVEEPTAPDTTLEEQAPVPEPQPALVEVLLPCGTDREALIRIGPQVLRATKDGGKGAPAFLEVLVPGEVQDCVTSDMQYSINEKGEMSNE